MSALEWQLLGRVKALEERLLLLEGKVLNLRLDAMRAEIEYDDEPVDDPNAPIPYTLTPEGRKAVGR